MSEPSSSPDASLTQDDSYTATSHRGLTYPWGKHAPETGQLVPVGDGIGWIRIPLPGSLGHINCWVLDETGDNIAIVDSGIRLPGCIEAWEALFAGPLKGKRVSNIYATHMHPDHIGLVGWLAKRDGAPLHMTRGEWLTAKFAVADVQDEVPQAVLDFRHGSGWTAEQVEASKASGWGRMRGIIFHLPHSYIRIHDGDILTIGSAKDSNGQWRVIVGSGHSPEHACLYNEAQNILIAGDQLLPRISSNVSLGASEPLANPLGEWLASIDKLLAALPEDVLVLPAHGEPFRGAHARLNALKSEHLERLDMLEAWVTETPRTTVECFPKLFYREIGDDHRGLATGEALAHLRWLEVEGRITRDTVDGVWMWRGV